MVKSKNQSRVSVKIDIETYNQLKDERKSTGVPISTLIKFAVQNYIKK